MRWLALVAALLAGCVTQSVVVSTDSEIETNEQTINIKRRGDTR